LTTAPRSATIRKEDFYGTPLSQPPYPHQPQQFPPNLGYSYVAPFAPPPLRRAAILLFVLGALSLLTATCLGIAAWTIPIDQILAKANVKLPDPPPGFTIKEIAQIGYTIVAVCGILYAIALIILGFFVRTGSRGASITAIVLSVPAMLFLLCNLGSLPSQVGGNPAMLIGGGVFVGIPMAMFILACVWLTQGLRQIGGGQLAQQQYQMQLWQYQQQQGAYQQPTQPPVQPNPNDPWQRGYGTTAPPPPPPPGQPPQ
jgi:hypothetical protein